MTATDAKDSPSIVFSGYRLDRRGGQLTRAGTPIPLRPKTWAVLVHLAERPGVLLTRQDLLDAVWPDVAVTPDTLTKSIGELRVALGDDAKTPRFIETVHRRGFRFLDQTSSAPAFDDAAQRWRDGGTDMPLVVGRATELSQLATCFAKARNGERQLVFVTGPAGIGKTTLVEAFLESRSVHDAPRPVWIGRGGCVAQHGPREAYMPVLEALDRLARRPDAAGFVDLLRRTAPTWLAQLPWLIGDDAEQLRRTLEAARSERMLREFATLTEALTAEVPLVLVLEDLHWSDASTADLLALLAQRSEPARLMVIATYRPAEVAVHHLELGQTVRTLQLHRRCITLPVHELDEAALTRYLEARFPGAALPPTLAPALLAHTDGNPLFVHAVVEHLLSRGAILDTAPGWSFTVPPDALQLGVPDDARRLIASQLGNLSPADQALLDAASAAGTEFVAPAVAAALRCELDEVEARCEQLARAHRLLRSAGSSEWPDGSVALRYAFPHELYRLAVYEGLSTGTRQRLHRRIGEALEAAHGERAADIASELADHFQRGADPRRALHYLRAAAARAAQRFAGREAIGFIDAALTLAASLADDRERAQQELALRVQLAPLLSDHVGYASDALRRNGERAYELAQQVGTTAQRFEILYVLCHMHVIRADPRGFPPACAELTALAQELGTGDAAWLADSVRMRSATYFGRFEDACRLADGPLAGLRAQARFPVPLAYGPDPVIDVHLAHGYALAHLGHTERARATIRDGLAAARHADASLWTLTTALGLTALVEMLGRNPAAVRDLCAELLGYTAEHGFPFFDAIGSALDGWARLQSGELAAATAQLEHARAVLAASGAHIFSTHIQAFLAEAHLLAGNVPAGLAAADEGLAVAERTLDHSYWPELWRLKGELLSAARLDGAQDCWQRAIDVAGACQSRTLELRAATSLARSWQARGRGVEARALLDPLCGWFDAAATSPDLHEARALLAALAAPPPSATGRRPADRSPRQAPR